MNLSGKRLLEPFLDFISPKECLISEQKLPENNKYSYISEDKLLELSPPPHPINIRDRLLQELDKDELALNKVTALFKISNNYNVLRPIHLLKYTGIYQIGLEFGEMLSNLIDPLEYDFIIPVPIHHARLRERGFNQSLALSEGISMYSGIEIADDVIKRNKYTFSQARLNREERRLNLKNKFIVENSEKLKNKRVLLVDDVLTTGTTANTCAEVLLTGGARRVDAAVIAVSY